MIIAVGANTNRCQCVTACAFIPYHGFIFSPARLSPLSGMAFVHLGHSFTPALSQQ